MKLAVHLEGFDLRHPKIFATNVKRLLDQLVLRNREYLRMRKLPPLYRSGVLYRTDPPGTVSLADAPTVFARKWGHCAHLSAWLIAQLLEDGLIAGLRIKWAPRLNLRGRLYHVQVRLDRAHGFGPRGLGQIEDPTNVEGQILDPSRVLGMGQKLWQKSQGQQSQWQSVRSA